MISYGVAPALNEIEVTVFGPGFGEAIAVHFGENHWMLVDSCLDPHAKRPASLAYLDAIGVPHDSVRTIVASHWHDDHVRGMSDVARACMGAEFQISAAFNNKEAVSLLAAYSGEATAGLSRGTRELVQVLTQRDGDIYYVHQRGCILDLDIDGRKVEVRAVSPTQSALGTSIANLAQYLPRHSGQTAIGNVVPLKPNIEAVAIHIDFGGDAVLLGSDLEEHTNCGWTAVAADPWVQSRQMASAYKVAHHGSHTGDAATIWTSLLQPSPVAAVTPFNLGNQHLPTLEDTDRLRSQTSQAFLSSGASRKPQMDSPQLKRLGDIVSGLLPVNNGFGAIRLRRELGAGNWGIECFGDARQL